MENYIIRKLKDSDYDAFFLLIQDFRKTSFTKEQFINTLSTIQKSSDIWVIEMDGQLLGTGTILYEYKFIFDICILAHIEDICVKQEYRKHGFGKILMETLVNEAKQKGCYKITLDCMPENIGFYEKCHFEKRGQQMTILLKK